MGVALASSLTLLILLVGSGHTDGFDHSLRQTLLAHDPPMANRAWLYVTSLGSGMVITIFSVICILVLAATRAVAKGHPHDFRYGRRSDY